MRVYKEIKHNNYKDIVLSDVSINKILNDSKLNKLFYEDINNGCYYLSTDSLNDKLMVSKLSEKEYENMMESDDFNIHIKPLDINKVKVIYFNDKELNNLINSLDNYKYITILEEYYDDDLYDIDYYCGFHCDKGIIKDSTKSNIKDLLGNSLKMDKDNYDYPMFILENKESDEIKSILYIINQVSKDRKERHVYRIILSNFDWV